MIHFDGTLIYLTEGNQTKTLTIPTLLETYNALVDAPLADQNALYEQILPAAEGMYDALPPAARLHYDFWKNLDHSLIQPQIFAYTTQVSDIYHWELTIHPDGLRYRDVSSDYSPKPNTISEQLWSDFWFYGPLRPLPDLTIRQQMIALIRAAFRQTDVPSVNAHFPLFAYPKVVNAPEWVFGDYKASTFVILRDYGVEFGAQNFHDGLLYLNYISFEHCLTCLERAEKLIGKEVLTEICQWLHGQSADNAPKPEREPETNARSKQLYMNNGGQLQHIYLDGFRDEYNASAAEEAAWKRELIEKYTDRLQNGPLDAGLSTLARTLRYHGVSETEHTLLLRAEGASPRDRQAIASALWNGCGSEKGVEMLLGLLPEEIADPYWRDYVFNMLGTMRHSHTAREWIIVCLQGKSERYFAKAIGVLQMWALYGDERLADPDLLQGLTWENQTAQNLAFETALQRLQEILNSPKPTA